MLPRDHRETQKGWEMLRTITMLSLIFLSSSAFAWGNFGHQLVGEIASRHLCTKTARAVNTLLNGQAVADAATWADDIRTLPEYKHVKPWHYVTMNLDSDYLDAPVPARGDLIIALKERIASLSNPIAAKRDEALRLIIHFVGDAHQPFHAGEHADGGGNGIQLTWFGYPSNLHKVWDTRMIKKLGLSFTELANFIDTPSAPPVRQLTPEEWVNESSKIAAGVYPPSTELGYAYHDKHLPIAKERLYIAGIRLSNLLNSIFGCN